LFLWSWAPAILCLALAMMIPDRGGHVHSEPPKTNWNLGAMPPGLRRYLAVIALFSLGNSSNMFLLLRARELGITEADIPLLWALLSTVAAVFSTPLAAFSDRVGRIKLLVVGYLAYGIFYAAMGLLQPGLWMLCGLFAFYGLFMAATEGVERAMVADFASPEQRGTAFGWFNLMTGAMLLPASLIFGALYQLAPTWAFGFSATCALGALVLLLLLMKTSPAVR
jgi:MFS family permease